MGIHARIEPGGHISINHTAWIDHRTGGPDPDLTTDLHTWATTHPNPSTGVGVGPGDEPEQTPDRDWPALARAWCTTRGYEIPEPDLIAHPKSRLDASIWVLRATAARYPIAVIGLNDDPPVVHAEVPHLDPWYWFDADSVDIGCPSGHGWTWRTGREMVTADGDFTTLTVVFGPDLDAPFTPCPACAAHAHGDRRIPCGCDGTPWIRCPTCGARCDVELPTR